MYRLQFHAGWVALGPHPLICPNLSSAPALQPLLEYQINQQEKGGGSLTQAQMAASKELMKVGRMMPAWRLRTEKQTSSQCFKSKTKTPPFELASWCHWSTRPGTAFRLGRRVRWE